MTSPIGYVPAWGAAASESGQGVLSMAEPLLNSTNFSHCQLANILLPKMEYALPITLLTSNRQLCIIVMNENCKQFTVYCIHFSYYTQHPYLISPVRFPS
jgi:hypothetical protein